MSARAVALTATHTGVLCGPAPGDRLWETAHGVKMRMPTASYPYYRLDYRLGGVRRTPCGGTDWVAAWAEANRIDALVAADLGLGSELAVRHLAEQWFAVENGRWSDRCREETRRYLDRVVIPGIGALPLPELRRAHLRELLDGIERESVRQKVRVVASGMLAWGHGEGLLAARGSDLMPAARRGGQARHEPTWVDPAEIPDEADVVALYQALTLPRQRQSCQDGEYAPPPWLAMLPMVAASTGARQGECFALRGSDVDGDMLLIDEQVQVVDGKPKLVPPKMGKIRKVVLSAGAFGLDVRAWMKVRAEEVGPEGLIFPTPTGLLWRRSNYLADSFSPARIIAWGSLKWPFHGLRHLAATRMLQRGIDIKDVSLMLGHDSVRTTQDMYVSHQASALDRIRSRI